MIDLLIVLVGGALVAAALGLAGIWLRLREALDLDWPRSVAPRSAEASSELDRAEARGRGDIGLAGPDPPEEVSAGSGSVSEPGLDAGDPPQSVIHEVPTDVSEFLVPDFRPGLDMCRVSLTYPDVDFAHWREENGVTLAFFDGAERLTLMFYGLSAPPLADIAVDFVHPRRGPQSYLLSELVDAQSTEIPPGPGDWPNRKSPGGETMPDGGNLTEFAGFDPVVECIEVVLPDGAGPGARVSVRPSDDGNDALVLINGEATAILRGAPEATSRNIRLVEVSDSAAA